MSVIRTDLNKCIGCENCVNICPMDVFYFDAAAHKSVLAYPENCQSCGQCFVNCKGRALAIANETFGYPITAYRGVTTAPMNHMVMTDEGVLDYLTKGALE
jgi:NAD-dependent dihydropyrimidine dehydrogenase PreA subunit